MKNKEIYMKFAWYSCEASDRPYGDGYHKDINSFSKAFKAASKVLINKWHLVPAVEP